MKIVQTSDLTEAWNASVKFLEGRSGMIVVTSEGPGVMTGRLNTFDAAYCEQNSIPVAYGEYIGGSIVVSAGDLSIMKISWGTEDFGGRVIAAFADWLADQGLPVALSGNDVLLDGKKVASWMQAVKKNGWCQSGAHFSVNIDRPLIDRICLKPMVKTPGALADYGIDTKMILDMLIDKCVIDTLPT